MEFVFDSTQVTLIVGVILPVIVGLFVNSSVPGKVKVIINIVASGLAALIVNAVNEHAVSIVSMDMLYNWLLTMVISIASYLGMFKPIDMNDRLPTVKTPITKNTDKNG